MAIARAATHFTWIRAWASAHRLLELWEDPGCETHPEVAWRRGVMRSRASGWSRAADVVEARGLGEEGWDAYYGRAYHHCTHDVVVSIQVPELPNRYQIEVWCIEGPPTGEHGGWFDVAMTALGGLGMRLTYIYGRDHIVGGTRWTFRAAANRPAGRI